MSEFRKYKRKGHSEMCEWEAGMVIDHVSISDADKVNGSPKKGDMIARNPKNYNDQWLVAKKYFEDNLELVDEPTVISIPSSLEQTPSSPTLGQKRVKAEFNPAKDGAVDKIKNKAAELIDLLEEQRGNKVIGEEEVAVSGEKHRIISLAQTNVETAAMYGVKSVFTD
jgi:hypothetical protein